MSPKMANFRIVTDNGNEPLYIADIGPWDEYPTITNSAEEVVRELCQRGMLPDGRRLFYVDSAGHVDEIVHKHGSFMGFRPGANRKVGA